MRVVDITSFTRTRRAQAAFDRIEKYVGVMRSLGRPVEAVTVSADDRAALLSAANVGRDKWQAEVTAVTYNGVPIK